ncbi:hypothetical protein HN018_17440 [Lichenicola cladoniae]|uniref:Uncharacterized protein n=1 Tax=Lichenicola cladoniae TaxID=1484109 RepID=A0A6M8HST4_9PROT|nr:hypothetical protein [Lichenicola cladoniae]NPD65332.1 hypothetical protein [Acetobacteraceae bacterium]QKE91579.1 hypothetical protein HN018_17440 [Lichenicola cladoniae]
MPPEIITAYAIMKQAAADADHLGGDLNDKVHKSIVKVCDEILASGHLDMFPFHIWMNGSFRQQRTFVARLAGDGCAQAASSRSIRPLRC